MNATLVLTAVSAVGSVAAAVGSLAAARVAVSAARQSKASAQEANAAAKTLAAIERDRRHDELRPEFDVSCTLQDPDSDSATLYVALRPGRLELLDEVTITILDETGADHWARGLPDGITQEQAEAFVWGPWEFNTGASAQVESNRTTVTRPYSLVTGKNWDTLSLHHTRPGRWMTGTTQQRWRMQHKGRPIRLLFTCRREGYEPWIVLHEVEPEAVKRTRIHGV